LTVEAPRSVRCRKCGSIFGLSARNVRAARQRGREPVCSPCRQTEKPIDEAEMEKLRRWWLEESGLTLDELLEIGRMLGWCG
jgi:hypothetical protein